MQVNVAFRHMDASPAVQQYASDKLEHVVSKYVQGEDIDSQITFSVERFWHVVNFTININGLTVKSSEKTEDMYSSIDLALEKVERQVRRYKSKIRSHRPDSRQRSLPTRVVTQAVEEVHAEAEIETAAPAPPPALNVVETENYTAPFMTVDQAVMQLELAGDHFLVFTNEADEHVNILFRRDDGKFGLIVAEPQHH
ncbi:MAG: ribosome-associated translation inhibitor RaiA [Myxococcales bacterium]|nr:ribosome-associated translation inhibitor RaiA [Myxococcales bacterium]MCB9530966.1 ribosome-associated translation inhibitor RaiA [Myxococcales bacterium]MCB9532886.1 ribosome-associated translation inhibitor RaiA [Myxococcales bacterium]